MSVSQNGSAYWVKRLVRVSAVTVSVVLACGCMQSTSSQSGAEGGPEKYEYKGRIDPLTTASVEDRTAILSERFKLIQARQ